MPSLAASHSVGRTDPPMNSMVQTGHVMMNVIIYESNKEVYIMIIYTRVVITLYIYTCYILYSSGESECSYKS